MRAGVWCVALALLAVSGALRPTQAEGTTRVGRRPPIHTSTEGSTALHLENASTPRSRGSRRREETSPRQAVPRTRTRPQIEAVTEPDTKSNRTTERFDSRRTYSRTRNRPETEEDTPKANVIRSRTRYSRPAPTQTTPASKTPEVTSPNIDESKLEVINSTLEEITKMVFKEYEPVTQSNRRSSTRPSENVTQRRRRVNTRNNEQSDLASSGTTNSISIAEKGPTTDKMNDLRSSRRLRYKQRLSETDANFTGFGITASDEVKLSSQKVTPSQETKPTAPVVENVQQNTETNPLKLTTSKVMRIVRRPVQRGKGSFKPTTSESLTKKRSDEVSEDDNYPEPFKALFQAKNSSTELTSPNDESLTVKASQKVYDSFAPSQQSTLSSIKNKYSRLRPKSNVQKELKNDIKLDDKPTEDTVTPKALSTKEPGYKFRTQQTTRSRKFSSLTSTTPGLNTEQSTDKPTYKYNRKFKVSTTEASKTELKVNSKRVETNNLLKRTSHRPTFYARRNVSKSDASTTAPSNEDNLNIGSALESIAKHKASLPRTSYYNRQRNSNKVVTVTPSSPSTEEPFRDNNSVIETADRKNVDNVDMPLIYTLLKPTDVSQNGNHVDISQKENYSEKPHKMFVIAVTSKESQENSTENEMTSNTVEETEVKPVLGPSTPKYHATYTVPQVTSKAEEHDVFSAVPPITNIPTRKFGRGRVSSKSQNDGVSEPPVTRDRGSGKYTDSYTKTTEASTNGITSDTDKSRHRFSSKYKAAHLEKPIYRATVPTVTPSTAWLKFFVTDRLLTKYVEEPNWFEEEYYDVTTPVSGHNTTPPITFESSIDLIEREEYQLGPGMNAISFTQTRSPAELLKLSESLVKPHVMNVEASQHSQSVTVSIFDALADILTSTPRNRLSSTTEVQKQNIKTDSIQSLNVVSSNINVNNRVLPSQDTLNVIVTTNVQNTDKTLNVNNLSVAAGVTSAPTTSQSLPTPIPYTPVSARKPFAFKVLYSEPTDKLTTAPEPTSNQSSTDNPSTVYNTVSDLLLSNNNVVSSELTSMLSSNINNILRNMDDRTRARVSADMRKMLKNLIPRAIDGLADDVDSTPNTTPYSLEEIKDTENVNFDVNLNVNGIPGSFDLLQNTGTTSNVNITNGVANTISGVEQPDFTQVGNNQVFSQLASLLAGSNDGITTTANLNRLTTGPTTGITATPSVTVNATIDSSFVPSNSDSIVIESGVNNNAAPNNLNVPFPFLSNFQKDDFMTQDSGNFNNSVDFQNQPIPFSATPSQNDDDSNIQDINNVTPLQLWILSKKARILKMIEDLLRDHNNELANATALTEMFRQTDNSPISERLTEIMSTMNATTKPTDSGDSSLSTTPSLPTPLSTLPPNESLEAGLTTNTTSSEVASSDETFTPAHLDDISTSTSSTSSNAETATAMSTTEAAVEFANRSLNDSTTATSVQETTTQNIETVTPTDVATTTQANQETTTPNDIETTTEVEMETTTNTNEQTDSASTFDNQINNSNPSTIPKKDYVIFGILPNNTVIRKNPNDDILETLTEASPYIVYGLLPNNTVIRKFPNGTRVPRVMQKIDILPISPWSLRNPYSPIHNNPAIVRPQSNPIRVSTNVETSTSNNGSDRLTTTDTVNNLQNMISTSALNIKDSSRGVTTVASKPADHSTASHVLSLRTTTMLPSVDEILLNSLSSAAKEEMVISSMTSSTRQPTILTLDIDPETKQIRTEKPGEIKFISIDEVTTTTSPNSNVFKLASSKSLTTTVTSQTETVTESSTQTPQIPTLVQNDDQTTTVQVTAGTITDVISESTTVQSVLTTSTTEASTTVSVSTEPVTTTTVAPVMTTTTTEATTTTAKAIETTLKTTIVAPTTPTPTTAAPTTTAETLPPLPTTTVPAEGVTKEDSKRFREDAALLEAILSGAERLPKKLNFHNKDQSTGTSSVNTQTKLGSATKQNDNDKSLLELLSFADKNPHTLTVPNIGGSIKVNGIQTTTARSIEDDIRQFEEDTKLLKALLEATGQDPAKFNIPTLDFGSTTTLPTTERITTSKPTETIRAQTTTPSIDADITRFQEDAKLLQALLQATGQNNENFNIPVISGITSNVRIASNPLTTSLGSSPTTPVNVRPIYTTLQTTTLPPSTVTIPTTFQPRVTDSTTARISTTVPPFRRRPTATTVFTNPMTVATARRVPIPGFTVTTEIPTSSTFTVEEDLAFLNNLKSVLDTNTNNEDPEAALANRIIALAVDRSLNEIKTGQGTERTGKNLVPTTAPTITTTTTTTTTTPQPTTAPPSTPSIEDDLKQFQEDTKLLQALLKATGQDPSKFNLPTLPKVNANVSPKIPPGVHSELNLLSNLLASPSPLNEPFDSLTQKPKEEIKMTITTPKPYGAKIVVKDDSKNVQDDGKLLQTLIQLQGVQETTTQKSKIAITGQSTDEALKKLIQQTQPKGMMQEATKMPIAISTEYGKSNDALLAALLKEQGFGPTTASSLDEQLRLAALLNQVVVTPKARRTTTPPPPPPTPRRPILDGLAWLWQQWRETGSGTGANRPNRRPDPAPTAAVSASQATSNRVNWFGSGPFVGNADDRPNNRIPLEPPRAVTSEQTPGRGQLVSAAINVTRAFSQFLGAAIQGAAQTVQSVIRAGQRAATDVYSNGSGASG